LIATALEEIKASLGSNLPTGIIAICDDATLYLSERGTKMIMDKILSITQSTRDKINLQKSSILVKPGRRHIIENIYAGSECPLPITDEGFVVLGNPVGTLTYRKEAISDMLLHHSHSIPALVKVDPQSAYAILSHCINARPAYLTRVADPETCKEPIILFDEKIDAGLALISRSTTTISISLIRGLPIRFGGLGLSRHWGPSCEKGCQMTRDNTKTHILSYRSDLVSSTNSWEPLDVYFQENKTTPAEFLLDQNISDSVEDSLPQGLSTELKEYRDAWIGLHHYLRNNGRRHHAAWLLSSSSGKTGQWLNWKGGTDGRFRFNGSEFIEALRLRQLIDPCPLCDDMRCETCQVDIARNPLHPLCCANMMRGRRWRHDRIRDQMAICLKDCFPDAEILMEKQVMGSSGRGTKLDVYCRNGPASWGFDIGIVDSTCPTYLHMSSDSDPDVAANAMANTKRSSFFALGVPEVTFIPVIFEVTGRLGPIGSHFFDTFIAEAYPEQVKLFFKQTDAIIMRWNAKMVAESRSQFVSSNVARRQLSARVGAAGMG
jgi:hypothetical protein